MAGYTPFGPWNPGAPPGVNAAFLNALETFLQSINSGATDPNISAVAGALTLLGLNVNPPPVTINGSVSGTVTLIQTMTGTDKRVKVYYNNYKSSGTQSITLPVAFTGPSQWQVYELQTGGKVEGVLSGSAQTFSVLTGLNLTGGSQSPQVYLNSYSEGQLRAGFDTFRITITGIAASGIIIIEGV